MGLGGHTHVAGGLHTAFDTSILETFSKKLCLGFYIMSLHGNTSFLFVFVFLKTASIQNSKF